MNAKITFATVCIAASTALTFSIDTAAATQTVGQFTTHHQFSNTTSAYLAVKCGKNKVYNKKKKKCELTPAAQGARIFQTSCALSGCHAGEGNDRFIGLTPESLDAARVNVPQMQFINLSGAALTKLFAFIKTLR